MSFRSDFVIIGHRGAAGLAPENTIAGFKLAQNLGVDAVELDVRLVGSHLAVFHDATLDRTTNGIGNLDDLSWSELRRLDAGGGQPVPELAEVLACLRAETSVNIELKGLGTGAACAEFLRSRKLEQEIVISSFHVREIHEFREHIGSPLNDVQVSLLVSEFRSGTLNEAAVLGATSLHLRDQIATASYVRDLIDTGLQVFVFTVNEVARARQLRDMKVRGIFTSYPDRMLELRC